MLERLPRAARNLALLGLALLAGWFCWTVRSVLNPLLVGYLLAYILLPLVAWVERRGHSRRAAVNLIFGIGLVLALGLGLALVAQMQALAQDVYAHLKATAGGGPGERAPLPVVLQARADEFTTTLSGWGLNVQRIVVPDLEGLRELARRLLAEYGDEAGRAGLDLAGRALLVLKRFFGGVFNGLALLVLVPLYSYYFLFVMADLHAGVQRYFPRRERVRLTRVFERIGEVISSFFRGRLSVAFAKGLFLAVGLTLLDMPYGFLFGMLSGLLSIIPFIGAFLGFVLALVVGLLEHGVIGAAWRAALVFGAGEVIEGYVLIPRILGDKLGLHPLVVFFALLAGGAALGMLGLLIALPLTATLVILFQEFVAPALRQFADEPS
ncbi:MAG TPA: AI-2E family transporter [Planctomycetota bacterium]